MAWIQFSMDKQLEHIYCKKGEILQPSVECIWSVIKTFIKKSRKFAIKINKKFMIKWTVLSLPDNKRRLGFYKCELLIVVSQFTVDFRVYHDFVSLTLHTDSHCYCYCSW